MSEREFHPLVKQLLDGDITIADLPAELRAEGEEALRLVAAVDRREIALPSVTSRVMATLRHRPQRSGWRRLLEPREIRVRIRPWVLGPALAVAAVLAFLVVRPKPGSDAGAPSMVTVRFVLSAPQAQAVSVAGTFNRWDAQATPLVRNAEGEWTATLTLPAGQHQYAFVVDGVRWLPDPAAPAIDDGFGRRNSVLTL